MLQILVISVLLSLSPAWGQPNATVIASCTYDDEPIKKMQHQMELQSLANENLRLRLEIITEILYNIRGQLSADNFTGLGTKKHQTCTHPTSCLGLAGGLQVIQLKGTSPFMVPCDNATHGGGWAVIHSRLDGFIDFNRNRTAYKRGFGDLDGEFFIGLDKLHDLTTSYENELLIIMRDKENEERFAKYETFAIGGEDEDYALKTLGKYSGDAGDSLTEHRSERFFTTDNDNESKCAETYEVGEFIFERYDCYRSQLNGKYGNDTPGQGINWATFHGYEYSLPYVRMMVRPKSP